MWAFDDPRAAVQLRRHAGAPARGVSRALREAEVGAAEGQSIHGAPRVKEAGLAALAEAVDTRGRDSFMDRWEEGGKSHDWADATFTIGEDDSKGFTLSIPEGEAPGLTKHYRIGADGMLEVDYTLSSTRSRMAMLTVELNLGLHVPNAPDRYVEINGARAEPPHFAARARTPRCRARGSWTHGRTGASTCGWTIRPS
jgi:hypothetical protein